MRKKTGIVLIFFFFIFASSVFAVAALDFNIQEQEEADLAPKYKAFLAEAQRILDPMTSKERDVFFGLKNDRERDIFIEAFWKVRGGRQRGVRASINLLMLMRMAQVLDLSEEQIAKIMPVMNQNEREKQALQREIRGHMAVLQIFINEETPFNLEDREEHNSRLNAKLSILRNLRNDLRAKEIEFDTFLTENLTPLQQAKYFVFSQEFYRGLREKLNDARSAQLRLRQQRKKR